MNSGNPSTMEAPDSFAKRANDALKGQFEPQMSRAVILLAVFEANRIMTTTQDTELANANNSQRKIAVLTIAIDLIYTLEFLTNDEKARLISMTPKRKKNKPAIARTAFHCAKLLEKEVQSRVLSCAEKLTGEGKTHDQFCDEIVQSLYEEMTGKSGPYPPLWIFLHRPIFLVYRVYYRGMNIDPNIFEAKVPRRVVLPSKRPVDLVAYVYGTCYPLNAPEKKDDTVEDPMLVEPNVPPVEGKPDEDEIQLAEDEDDMMTTNDNAALNVGGINRDKCDVMNPDGEGNSNQAELDPVLRKSRLMNRKHRIQQLSELKLRLALLNEMETSNSFTEEKLNIEKNEIFDALSRLVLENPVENRRVLFRETELLFGLLKDLKRSNAHPQECNELLTTMYLKLPPLSDGIDNTKSMYLMAKREKAARLAQREAEKKAAVLLEQKNERARKKAARLAKRKERKEKAAAQAEHKNKRAAQGNENSDKERAQGGWEVVDEMDEVNAYLAGLDMTS